MRSQAESSSLHSMSGKTQKKGLSEIFRVLESGGFIIKKWGNSFGVRLTKKELEEYGLKEGDEVKIRIEKVRPREEVDLLNIPTFSETDKRVSEHHDKYLYGSG